MEFHPDYLTAQGLWQVCRDVAEGQEAVHRRGETYLPRLAGQDEPAYRAYRDRTPFFNATRRTIEGLSGLVFRKPVRVDAPVGAQAWLADMDRLGNGLQALAETVLAEVLTVGRAGMLVDHPLAADDALSVAEADARGMRPYVRLYYSEQIMNWKVGAGTQGHALTHVTLLEPGEDGAADRLRTLDLDPEDGLVVALHEKQRDGTWITVETVRPVAYGAPLRHIPFLIQGPKDTSVAVARPPLLDLVHLNLSHYRTAADLEHGAHFTGLPTVVITGHSLQPGETLSIGAGEAWVLPSSDAKATFLEFKGDGLATLERLLDRKEAQMAALGARLLGPERLAAEAAQTLRIRRLSETSALAAMAAAVSAGLTRVLGWMTAWAGVPGDVYVSLNRDHLPEPMEASELLAHVRAWQAGALSDASLFEALKRGEVVDSHLTMDADGPRRPGDAADDSALEPTGDAPHG